MIDAKIGDFVTVSQKGLPPDESGRQGILVNENTILYESGEEIEFSELHAVVPDQDLWGSIRDFVLSWREQNN